ncbi:MAG: DUF3592 domain-containing protein [Gammaproteobacteria bacterium]|nr:DUF3592 domain-containing protein [Gammaproteobacteria bacterium]
MKGRIFGTLFALPFFSVGVWMLWSIGATFHSAWQMSAWTPTDARLTTAGYETHRGDDSFTYEAYARYTYSYFGQTFTGDRVSLASGGDNIGDYQQDLGSRLSAAMRRGDTITVWVNPDNPTQSIIDRSIRWGLLGFKSIFLFVFGGVGLGLLIIIWRAPDEKDKTLPQYQQSPWLLNDKWQSASLRSDSKAAMLGAWFFAGIWCLISAPLPFVMYDEIVDKQNYLALVAVLFPIVGIGLLIWAIRRTREWRRFGATPLVLDPFPGSIGGHVGGTIDTNLRFESSNKFMLTLTSLQSYVSGSGDSRSKREKALWQDERLAHIESSPAGTRLTFRFDVPAGLKESDAEQAGDSYHLWRLNVRASLPNADLDREFTLPVYATATESKHIAERSAASSRAEQDAIYDQAVRDIVRIQFDGVTKTLIYPMGRNLLSNLAGFFVGSVFAAAGWFMIFKEGMTIFGGVFGSVGVLIAITAFYLMLKSLEIRQQGNSIVAIRRWIGIPIRKREMRRSDFSRFEKDSNMQTQSGGKHVMYFKVRGIDRQGNDLILGEGFRGESGADAAIRFLSRELGLSDTDAVTRRKRDAFDEELVNEF